MAKRILIVDDDQIITNLLRKRLEDQGFECEEVFDGAEALSKVNQDKFDLVFVDYAMPNLKGDEFCNAVREIERLKELPLIVITAYSNKEPDFFLDNGATDVMYKPIDEDLLEEKIAKYLPN